MNEIITMSRNDLQKTEFNNLFFQRFINYIDVSEVTMKGYVVCLHQFAIWINENGISSPVREDIKNYKSYLSEQGFTAGTQARYLRVVKQFFKWTSSEGIYPNVADNVKGTKVKNDNTKKQAFNEEDIKTVLESIETETEAGKRDHAMILLSVTGGLRIIEMQRANIEDIQTIQGHKVLFIQGKGHKEKDDYIKIIPEVAECIEDYLNTRKSRKKTEPLFVGTGNRAGGERLTEPSISRIIKTRFKEAGFDCSKLTAHSLRHTSNTLLFKAGADLFTVQQHARHCDPKTTEIYLHTVEKEKDRSEQIVYDQIFNQSSNTFKEEATTLLQNIPEDKQRQVLNYLQSICYQEAKAM